MAYGSVGLALAENLADTAILDDAIRRMRGAAEDLLDTGLDGALKQLEERRRQWRRDAASQSAG
jgi:hypothetical protein